MAPKTDVQTCSLVSGPIVFSIMLPYKEISLMSNSRGASVMLTFIKVLPAGCTEA